MAQVWDVKCRKWGRILARPKKDEPIHLSIEHELGVGLIDRLTRPAGQPKAFLRDAAGNGLKIRVTANGSKAFVYEAKINGKAFSRTLGKWGLMTILEAREGCAGPCQNGQARQARPTRY